MINKKERDSLKIRGKVKCPACGWPANQVYEGASGLIGNKCRKCGVRFITDTSTLISKIQGKAG